MKRHAVRKGLAAVERRNRYGELVPSGVVPGLAELIDRAEDVSKLLTDNIERDAVFPELLRLSGMEPWEGKAHINYILRRMMLHRHPDIGFGIRTTEHPLLPLFARQHLGSS